MQEYAWVIMVDGRFVRLDKTRVKTQRLSRATFFRSKSEAEEVGKYIPHRSYRQVVIGLMA